MVKRCRIVCDTVGGLIECELALPDEATVGEALEAARSVIGAGAADWTGAPAGIFGRRCQRQQVPADGDRIELYRALPLDPRRARRERVARAGGRRGRR